MICAFIQTLLDGSKEKIVLYEMPKHGRSACPLRIKGSLDSVGRKKGETGAPYF